MPEGSSVPPEQKRLDRALVRGIAWTGGMKWATQLLSWASTLVVARLLSPADYGLVGMATVYLGLMGLLNEFGLGSAIVMQGDLSDEQIAQINTLSLVLGFAGFVVSCGLALPIASFFAAPQLCWVVPAMSVTFILMAFKTVPAALLQRQLRFRSIALSEGSQALVQSGSMVLMAWFGCGYWTLVVGPLIGNCVSTLMLMVWKAHRFSKPNLRSIQGAAAFSSHVLISRIAWYIYSNSDFVIAGRVLGKVALGAYNVAWDLASMPVDKISALVGRVTPAFFSAVQNDPLSLRRYLLKLTEGLALVTLPASAGLALVAPEFVHVALGQKWSAAIVPLQILAAYASLRSITTLLAQILFVTGDSRFVMGSSILSAIVMPCMFYLGSNWGTTGIAAAWVIGFPVVIAPLYVRVFRVIGLDARAYVRSLRAALTGAVLMALVVLLLKLVLSQTACPATVQLILEVTVGGGIYMLALFTLHPNSLRGVTQLLRGI